MLLRTVDYGNGRKVAYKIVEGTAYHLETPDPVVSVLSDYQEGRNQTDARLEIALGDTVTGRSWGYPESGYIGRSTGSVKIPLLIPNSRSTGGFAILDHCIVRICTARGKLTLYQHPLYHEDELA